MRKEKAVTSFDVFYKETFAQQISKAAYNMPGNYQLMNLTM
jgi:hypothetical protein